MDNYHIPVLLNEAINLLNVKDNGKYIDATLGGGGHSDEILKKGGKVLGLDLDEESISEASERLKQYKNFKAVHTNFAHLEEVANKEGFEKVDGILFDLGVSSHQLDEEEKGFSFNSDNLDMRMDSTLGVTAKDLVNGLTKIELLDLFTKLGEEKNAWAIVQGILKRREEHPIESGKELARVVIRASHFRSQSRVHPATRIFQALRIAVNDELNNLKSALPQAIELLNPTGRIVAISFHSLEDRIVKNQFKESEESSFIKILTEKPLVPGIDEIMRNPRSRSSKLRAAEKI